MSDPQTPKPISLDELLASQAKPTTKAVIEAVPGDDAKIKLTPWSPGVGCSCASSIILPRSTVASVTSTGEKHFCCGKELSVVAVEFATGASLDLNELLQQLAATSARQNIAAPAARSANLFRNFGPRPNLMVGGPACVYQFCQDHVRYCVTEDGVAWAAGSC